MSLKSWQRDHKYFATCPTCSAEYGDLSRMECHEKERAWKQATLLPDVVAALENLYNETADYIRVNHLGKVHHNRSMKQARAALRAIRRAAL